MHVDPDIAKVNLLLSMGRFVDARRAATEALPESSFPAVLTALISQSFQAENRMEEAQSMARRAVELDPECAFAYFQMARIDFKRGLHQQARGNVDEALQRELWSPYFALSANLHSLARQPVIALEQARAGLALNGDCQDCRVAEFLAQVDTGTEEEKKGRADLLLQEYPESPQVLAAAGVSLACSDIHAGRMLIAASLAIQPENQALRLRYLTSLVARSGRAFLKLTHADQLWRDRPTGVAHFAGFCLIPAILSLSNAPRYHWIGALASMPLIGHVSFASARLKVYMRLLLGGQGRLMTNPERSLGWLTLCLCGVIVVVASALLLTGLPWLAVWGLCLFTSFVPLGAADRFPSRPRWIALATFAAFLSIATLGAALAARAVHGGPVDLAQLADLINLLAVAALIGGFATLVPES